MAKKAPANVSTTTTTPTRKGVAKKVGKGNGTKATVKKAEPKPEPKPEPARNKNVTQTENAKTKASRLAHRLAIINAKYTREFSPMPNEVLLNSVVPSYKAVLATALKEGTEATVRITPTEEFLKAWIEANGANRPRKWTHVEGLILGPDNAPERGMRKGFCSAATHLVLGHDGMVYNGGHSGPAIACAFYPEAFWDTINPATLRETKKVGKDETTGEAITLYPLSEEFEAPTAEESEVMIDELGDKLQCNLVVNAGEDSLLKMDDLRLEAQFEDYLAMLEGIVKWSEDSQFKTLGGLRMVAQICRAWYLRTQCKEDKDGTMTFGKMDKGGRLNKPDVITWMLALVPMLDDAVSVLVNANGRLTLLNKLAGVLAVKDLLTAMVVSDATGRDRIANAVTLMKKDGFGEKLAAKLRVTEEQKKAGIRKPPADWIVSVLVSYGRGNANAISSIPEDYTQDLAYRADGWDRGEEEAEEDLLTTMLQLSQAVAKQLGDQSISAAIEEKAMRAGKGKRSRRRGK